MHLPTRLHPSRRLLPRSHLDFVFAVKEDVRMFVLSKLCNPLPG